MTIIIAVKYKLNPGKRDELLSFVADNVRNTKKEVGNLEYSHYPSLEHEDEMFVYEMWENLESVRRHINASHYVEFSKKRRPILASYESRIYEAQFHSQRNTAPLPE